MNGFFILANIYWFIGFTMSIFIVTISLYIKIRYKRNFKAFEPVFLGGGLLMGMSWMQCSMFEMNFKNIVLSFFEKNIYFSCFICTVLAVLFAGWLEKMTSSNIPNEDDAKKEDCKS